MAEANIASFALARRKEDILSEWECKVRENILPATHQSTERLRDHVPAWIDDLVRTLDPHRGGSVTNRDDPASRRVGLHRATLPGYTLPVVLKEYSLLRQVILRCLEREGALNAFEREIINDAIDNALALAGDEFSGFQQQRIQASLEATERSNADLERVATIAAHDLKSPLTVMTAYLDQMEFEGRERWPGSAKYVVKMRGQVTRLATMVDRLMTYASLRAQAPTFTIVSLNEILRIAIENAQIQIEARRGEVRVDELPVVRADATLMMQLFQNLIINGIKFNRSPTPRIHVAAREDGDDHVIEVRDDGIGIDADDLSLIFGAHVRLRPEEFPGSGLGLSIVKRIVDIHGGRIDVASRVGRGTTFTLRLPRL